MPGKGIFFSSADIVGAEEGKGTNKVRTANWPYEGFKPS